MKDFDVVVIGGALGLRCSGKGKSTGTEGGADRKGTLGGVCLNWGASHQVLAAERRGDSPAVKGQSIWFQAR